MPQERLKKLKAAKGNTKLGDVTLNMAIGGMRGIPVNTGPPSPTPLRVHTPPCMRRARGFSGSNGANIV